MIATNIGASRDEGATWGNLGLAHLMLSDRRRALECLSKQLTITRTISDKLGELNAMHNIGVTHMEMEKPRKALGCWKQALSLAREISDRLKETELLIRMCEACLALDRLRNSIAYGEKALSIAKAEGAIALEIEAMYFTALAYHRTGDDFMALKYANTTLQMMNGIDDPALLNLRTRLVDLCDL